MSWIETLYSLFMMTSSTHTHIDINKIQPRSQGYFYNLLNENEKLGTKQATKK